MKAAVLNAFGGPDEFELTRVPMPEASPGEVLIRVEYAGINPADWKDREGFTAMFFDIRFPYIIGFDAAGTIAAIGEGVTDFAVGDRVFTVSAHGQGGQGSYAAYLAVPADRVAPIPEGLATRDAAVIPVAALTAWQALHDDIKGALASGQSVLINGGAGGVGCFAIQFARLAGARVATTCSERNAEYVRGLGAELALDYRQDSVASALLHWAPEGVDLLVDAVGSDSLDEPLQLIKPGGRLVSIATLTRDGDIEASIRDAAAQGKTKVFAMMDDVASGSTLAHIASLAAQGQITLPPVQEFPLEDVAQAHRLIEEGHVRGKLVLRIGDG